MSYSDDAAGALLHSWPTWRRVLPRGRHQDPWERLKYALRLALVRPLTGELLRTLRAHPAWARLYLQDPRRFHPAVSRFLNRRWSRAERFRAVVRDLECAAQAFGPRGAAEIVGGGIALACLPGGACLRLGLNRINAQEGHWALELRAADGRRLFNMAFGFVDAATLLIASVQGGERGAAPCMGDLRYDLRDDLRALTKACHGLRPAPLLLACLQCVAARWGIRELLGIDPTAHVKGRWNQRRQRLRFGYRELWAEHGGTWSGDAYWTLPLATHERPHEDIPSHKRALYRRRYALLDALRSAIADVLGPIASR